MMNINQQKYQTMQKKASPKSPVLKNCLWAFGVGGLICTLGEGLYQWISTTGLEEKMARMLASSSLVLLAVILTGLQVFDNIAKHAGAGTIVPITGFANSIVSPAIEFKAEGLVLGMAAKMFQIAGPVLVYGITAATIYGIILWFIGLF